MTFLSALILGLLASAHCAGMCGGLQTALQQPSVLRSANEIVRHGLILNAGRLTTYCVAGALIAAGGAGFLQALDLPQITQAVRYFTALLLILMGYQFLFSRHKPFAVVERLGGTLWQVVSKHMSADNSRAPFTAFKRGIAWGFLPCGLVYAVLLTTLFSAGPLQGGLVMLGFGLGTLPAMLLTGGVYQHFRSVAHNNNVRWLGGLVFIAGGVLMVAAPWLVDMDFMHGYPPLMSSLFCLS